MSEATTVPLQKRPNRLAILIALALVLVAGLLIYRSPLYKSIRPAVLQAFRQTVQSQIAKYGRGARERLAPLFAAAQIEYPPSKVALIAIKDTGKLHVYCAGESAKFKYLCTYHVIGASGHLGPKLREGDRQVPEGIYKLTLEPNTPYHLALRLNYPNEDDLARARADGRENPGSDILIHGSTGSIGCLAMGDEVSEELFVLVNDAKDQNTQLVIAPVDLREQEPPQTQTKDPTWLPSLYKEIKEAMRIYPKADGSS